jgi:hypothetical protein
VTAWIFEPGHTEVGFRARNIHLADLETTGAIEYYRSVEEVAGTGRVGTPEVRA